MLSVDAEHSNALPPGTRLGNFEVRDVIGAGGFGVVYRAFDHALEREVAVKEYMPVAMAGRTETLHVTLRSRSDQEVFELGLASFVKEAKLLAGLDHPALIKVLHFWEAHNTAYMAMPLLVGDTLKGMRLKSRRPPSPRMLLDLLQPLLGALEYLHERDVYHRDISPDNIHVSPEGRPVLLDFGAARRVIVGKSQTLTTILKPAYSPLEQYGDTQRQGPWTDLYALAATVHFVLTGEPPVAATERIIEDRLPRLAEMSLPGFSPRFLQALDWMLALKPADRPRSVAEAWGAMTGEIEIPARPRDDDETTRIKPPRRRSARPDEAVPEGVPAKAPGPRRRHLAWAGGGAAVLLASAGGWLLLRAPSPHERAGEGPGRAVASPAADAQADSARTSPAGASGSMAAPVSPAAATPASTPVSAAVSAPTSAAAAPPVPVPVAVPSPGPAEALAGAQRNDATSARPFGPPDAPPAPLPAASPMARVPDATGARPRPAPVPLRATAVDARPAPQAAATGAAARVPSASPPEGDRARPFAAPPAAMAPAAAAPAEARPVTPLPSPSGATAMPPPPPEPPSAAPPQSAPPATLPSPPANAAPGPAPAPGAAPTPAPTRPPRVNIPFAG